MGQFLGFAARDPDSQTGPQPAPSRAVGLLKVQRVAAGFTQTLGVAQVTDELQILGEEVRL